MKHLKFKWSWILWTTAVMLFACQKEPDLHYPDIKSSHHEQALNKFQKSDKTVSLEIARKLAIKFAEKGFNWEEEKTLGYAKEIEQEKTIGNENFPSFYIFNFKNKGGFVIVSAEINEVPILAYSKTGNFKTEGYPYGITAWLETTKQNIEQLRLGQKPINPAVPKLWLIIARKLFVPEIFSMVPADICEPKTTVEEIGPLIKTEWGQGCGYNDLCPIGQYCGGHLPTGCVATAMAQVIRYWQHSTRFNYDWTAMPTNSGSVETAKLMKDVGASVGMHYGANGSGANSDKIPGALKNTFGFNDAKNIDFDGSQDRIRSEISAGRPVLFSAYNQRNSSWFGLVVEYAEGHEWVCDGFRSTNIKICKEDGTGMGWGFLDFYMNWGWDGQSNGWYNFNTWAPSNLNQNYKYYKEATIKIHP